MGRFQEFMSECMKRKRLKGKSQDVIREEFRKCLEAWQQVVEETKEEVREIDEIELARRYVKG